MNRKAFLMMAGALAMGGVLVNTVGLAQAQPAGRGGSAMAPAAPVYDPAQLPQFKGRVAQYSLTPRGEVDGLILADGTEVHVPPFVSTQLVFAVKPGDAVTIHGMKAQAVPMVMARSIANDATGATVLVMAPRRGHGPMGAGAGLEAEGKIAAMLHSPRGEANGVRLEDGTLVRLPPPEAKRLAETLAVGKSIAVRGEGYAGPLGRVIAARQIGADKASLKDVAGPRHGERQMGREGREGRHGGMMHRGDGSHEMRRGDGDGHPGMRHRMGERG